MAQGIGRVTRSAAVGIAVGIAATGAMPGMASAASAPSEPGSTASFTVSVVPSSGALPSSATKAPTSSPGLAFTGLGPGETELALVVLAAGGGLVVLARARRQTDATRR